MTTKAGYLTPMLHVADVEPISHRDVERQMSHVGDNSGERTMRIRTALVVLAAAATLACAGRFQHPRDTASHRERQLVLAAEDAYVAAEVSRDEPALRRLVDEKFVNNAADGTTAGKEELIRSVLRMNMTGQTISERSIILEAGMAVIFGTAELQLQNPGQPPRTSRLRYTSVYVKRDGVWRMLALQMQARSGVRATP